MFGSGFCGPATTSSNPPPCVHSITTSLNLRGTSCCPSPRSECDIRGYPPPQPSMPPIPNLADTNWGRAIRPTITMERRSWRGEVTFRGRHVLVGQDIIKKGVLSSPCLSTQPPYHMHSHSQEIYQQPSVQGRYPANGQDGPVLSSHLFNTPQSYPSGQLALYQQLSQEEYPADAYPVSGRNGHSFHSSQSDNLLPAKTSCAGAPMHLNHPHGPSRLVSHRQVPPNVPFVEPLGGHNDSINTNLKNGLSLAPRSPGRGITSAGPGPITLSVALHTPRIEGGQCVYRERVTSQVSLSGQVPPGGIIMAPALPNSSQLVLRCEAECKSCAMSITIPQPCKPIGFNLSPVLDSKSDQPYKLQLKLDQSSGVFTANVIYQIRHRPRVPKLGDQEWRCSSEALILTYALYDFVGNPVARFELPTPFRARRHVRKGDHED